MTTSRCVELKLQYVTVTFCHWQGINKLLIYDLLYQGVTFTAIV